MTNVQITLVPGVPVELGGRKLIAAPSPHGGEVLLFDLA